MPFAGGKGEEIGSCGCQQLGEVEEKGRPANRDLGDMGAASAGTVIGKIERALLAAISGAVLSCLRVSFCRLHRRLSVLKTCCQQSALPWEEASRGGN